jgi:hypothetical protein
MNSSAAITVSGHVFAYPTVTSLGTSGSLLPLAPVKAAQDAPRLDSEAGRNPLWAIEYATAA